MSCVYVIRIFNELAAIIQENSTNNLGLSMMRALPLIHQHDRVARKASDVSVADDINHVKSYIFLECVLTTFLRGGNACITLQFI